jgi:hypothetical protein
MFKILLFQCATSDDFQVNMRGKDYISFSDMEYVDFFEVDNVDNPDNVLSMAFCICNDYDERRPKGLRYSMSVGDIVVIYDEAYRCMPMGWDKLDLSDSDYKIIQSIMRTLETTNNEENKENESEENEMGNVKNVRIEEAAAEKAKAIVGKVGDGLKGASEAALGLCEDVAYEAKVISAMSQTEAENHIRRKFQCAADKFIDWITDKLGIEIERSETADEILGEESEDTNRLKKALADFNKVRTEGEKSGWKKFKDILKAVFGIVFAVFIEVAKVVLKLAFALFVGTIKIGACAITTLASCVGIIGDDVVKPGASAAKKAYKEFKGNRASKKGVSVDDILDDDCFEN